MTRIPPAGLAATFSALLLLALWWGWVSGPGALCDTALREEARRLASPAVTQAMRGITWLGGSAFMAPFGVAVFLYLWRSGRRRAAVFFAVSALGGQLFSEALKVASHRARPEPWFDYPVPRSYSFPSGHAVAGVSFYGVLGAVLAARARRRAVRAALWGAAAALTLAIGFSRVYLGVHYPSDVLGGYAAAVLWVAAVHLASRALLRRRAIEYTADQRL